MKLKMDIMTVKLTCDEIVQAFEREMWSLNEHSDSYDMLNARYELFLTGSQVQGLIEFWLANCNAHEYTEEAHDLIEFRDHCFQQIILYYKAFSKNLADKVI